MTLTPASPGHLSPEARRRTLTFVAVGTVCTPAYLGLYAGLRTAMSATTANVVAQLVTTLMSTAGNRRLTMQVARGDRAVRHHLEMVGVFVLGLIVNDMALDLLAQAAPGGQRRRDGRAAGVRRRRHRRQGRVDGPLDECGGAGRQLPRRTGRGRRTGSERRPAAYARARRVGTGRHNRTVDGRW